MFVTRRFGNDGVGHFVVQFNHSLYIYTHINVERLGIHLNSIQGYKLETFISWN